MIYDLKISGEIMAALLYVYFSFGSRDGQQFRGISLLPWLDVF